MPVNVAGVVHEILVLGVAVLRAEHPSPRALTGTSPWVFRVREVVRQFRLSPET